MSLSDSVINSLINQANRESPGVADALRLIAEEVRRIGNIVDPPPITQSKPVTSNPTPPLNVLTFTYRFTDTNVILEWVAPSTQFLNYEIRKGTTWETADYITTLSGLLVVLDPLLQGSHTYLIKGINSNGVYSVTPASVTVIVPAMGGVALTSQLVDNNALLYWTTPTSTFKIDYYKFYKDGIFQANIRSNFTISTEIATDNYIYSIIPVDIAGNEGPEVQLELRVAGPVDFIIVSEQLSSFAGTKTNARVIYGDRLLVCVDTTKTFEDHFDDNSWASPQDQVDTGYPRYIQPAELTASYVEEFDFGTVLNDILVSISWSYEQIVGTTTIGLQVEVSDDGISWSSPVSATTSFHPSLRYVRVTIEFTSGTDLTLLSFFNFQVAVSVKREQDGGIIEANAGDAGGTTVTFNKDFKDIDSIEVSNMSTTAGYAIVDFVDAPNPTTFKVLAFDSAGSRITVDVRWIARGIV